MIHIERKGILGLYSFTAYIQYGFGFDLALVLTESEALKVLATTRACSHVVSYSYED